MTKALIPEGADVSTFEMPALKGRPLPTYQQIKATFDRGAMPVQNRFALSELVAGQLSVEQEEQRRFEKRVTDELEARLKIVRSEAHTNAYAKGLEEGQKKAYDEEKARIAASLEKLSNAVSVVESAKVNLAAQYEKMLLEATFKIAKAVVHKEIESNPAVVSSTILAILERIGKEDDVRIRLAPPEFEAIEDIKKETDRLGREGRVTFEMDPALKPGSCIVESPSGEIASFVDEKIEVLRLEIEKSRGSRRDGTTGG